jgi:tetratricopeptide (TPR) repeat protein
MKEEDKNLSAKELNEKGSQYYDQKEYEKAFEYFKKSADLGYPAAMHNLYICYINGQGVEKNKELAQQYFKQYENKKQSNTATTISYKPIEISEQGTRQDIHTIKSWVVFFGIMTVIELIIGLIFVISILSKLHNPY